MSREPRRSAYFGAETGATTESPAGADSERCTICLDVLGASCGFTGTVPACGHTFCFPCIIEWARVGTNRCPLCKAEFEAVSKRAASSPPGAGRAELVRVPKPAPRSPPEDDGSADAAAALQLQYVNDESYDADAPEDADYDHGYVLDGFVVPDDETSFMEDPPAVDSDDSQGTPRPDAGASLSLLDSSVEGIAVVRLDTSADSALRSGADTSVELLDAAAARRGTPPRGLPKRRRSSTFSSPALHRRRRLRRRAAGRRADDSDNDDDVVILVSPENARRPRHRSRFFS